jgi:hypothetical protein
MGESRLLEPQYSDFEERKGVFVLSQGDFNDARRSLFSLTRPVPLLLGNTYPGR